MSFATIAAASSTIVPLIGVLAPWTALGVAVTSAAYGDATAFAMRLRSLRRHATWSLALCGVAAAFAAGDAAWARTTGLALGLLAGTSYAGAMRARGAGRLRHGGWLTFLGVAAVTCLWPVAALRPAIVAAWIFVRHHRASARILADALDDLVNLRATLVARSCDSGTEAAAAEARSGRDKVA
jgi:hypothetical protein